MCAVITRSAALETQAGVVVWIELLQEQLRRGEAAATADHQAGGRDRTADVQRCGRGAFVDPQTAAGKNGGAVAHRNIQVIADRNGGVGPNRKAQAGPDGSAQVVVHGEKGVVLHVNAGIVVNGGGEVVPRPKGGVVHRLQVHVPARMEKNLLASRSIIEPEAIHAAAKTGDGHVEIGQATEPTAEGARQIHARRTVGEDTGGQLCSG